MKKLIITVFMSTMFFSFLLFAGSCEKEEAQARDTGIENIIDVKSDGTTLFNEDVLWQSLAETPALSTEELEMLGYMKDEEKLARDVYYALYDLWGALPFSNISKAEEQHMNAVILLLEYYGSNNVIVKDPGEFDNDEFKTLYDELVTRGSESVAEAFKVGALIEELDIKDLQELLEETSNENIELVFKNLLKGSRNHLRAFNRQFVRLGIDYEPQFIDQVQYDEIVNSPFEAGRQF
ncbi:MAG: DUF2202 domain-containing protein [Bacteroidales bacterium]|nr:DUF2202 domain-containing protein [Bacteroidales bacterium]